MTMTRRLASALLFLAAASASATGLSPTKTPVSPSGARAVIDLPTDQHIRNTGGMGRAGPGTGAGLCVPTSIQVAARWHGLTQMEGYQKWCTSRKGGSWPQKTAADIKEFCASKGVPVPPYVQSTGGDVAFLELVYRTRRMPAQTWTSSHMVSGAHLDSTAAAVIDNNRPGSWLWQSRREYLSAWNADGPGWVFCWLAPPPPPGRDLAPPAPTEPFDEPAPRPCPGPNCPRWQTVALHDGEVIHKLYAADGMLLGALCKDGWHVGCGTGWLKEAGGEVPEEAPPLDGRVFGPAAGAEIDIDKFDRTRPRYWLGEREVTRAEALAAVGAAAGEGLSDDSGNYHLSIVADASEVDRVKTVLADRALAPFLAKCHVQIYAPDSWVARTRLSATVTLQEPAPKGGRVLGTAGGRGLANILELVRPHLDPTWKPDPPPVPPVAPEPQPAPPKQPDKPAPAAEPKPDVKPAEEPKDLTAWLVAAVASILAAYRKGN